MALFSDRKVRCHDRVCCPQGLPGSIQKFMTKRKPQVVPPFTVQSLRRRNVTVEPFDAKERVSIKPYPIGNTAFRKFYERGDFPISRVYDPSLEKKIAWKIRLEEIDYKYYLPLFFTGLCEVEYPYNFYAMQGIEDLLDSGSSQKITEAVPQIILPIKQALNTRNRTVIAQTLKTLQVLASCKEVGEALVPYYRQILPPFNLYTQMNVHTGEEIDFSQQKRENISELAQETLQKMELNGGEDAYINIKYLIPTYESITNLFKNKVP